MPIELTEADKILAEKERRRHLSRTEQNRLYRQENPHYAEWLREYAKRPEVKAKRKAYYSRPDVMERTRIYRQKYYNIPENKVRHREYTKKYMSNPDNRERNDSHRLTYQINAREFASRLCGWTRMPKDIYEREDYINRVINRIIHKICCLEQKNPGVGSGGTTTKIRFLHKELSSANRMRVSNGILIDEMERIKFRQSGGMRHRGLTKAEVEDVERMIEEGIEQRKFVNLTVNQTPKIDEELDGLKLEMINEDIRIAEQEKQLLEEKIKLRFLRKTRKLELKLAKLQKQKADYEANLTNK